MVVVRMVVVRMVVVRMVVARMAVVRMVVSMWVVVRMRVAARVSAAALLPRFELFQAILVDRFRSHRSPDLRG